MKVENKHLQNQIFESYVPSNSESYAIVTEIYNKNAPFSSVQQSKLSKQAIILPIEETITSAIASIQLEVSNEVSLTLPDGSHYVGGWKNNMPQGRGKLTYFKNGVECEGYEGEWLNGEKHGHGTYFMNFGDSQTIYIGDWKNGFRHGKGTMSWPSGNLYTGDFYENEITGKGTMTEPDGTVSKGDFLNGRFHGVGASIMGNGNRYEGGFFENQIHGKGVYTFFAGTIMSGNFYQGTLPFGKIIHATFEYEGNLDSEHHFHGMGKLIDESGVWEGDFVKNMKHGVFIHKDKQGKIYEMIYDKNTLIRVKEFSKMQYKLHEKKALQAKQENESTLTKFSKVEFGKNKGKKGPSLDELLEFIEGPKTNLPENKKKSSAKHVTSIEPLQEGQKRDLTEKGKQKAVINDSPKKVSQERTLAQKPKDSSEEQIKTMQLLKEGAKYKPKYDARILRWGKKDVFTKMESFEDSGKFLYFGMSSVDKDKMILFHEGGSMLDPIIFHPALTKEYLYDTNRGKGCYAEIVSSTGVSYKGVIEFGIAGEKCFHRKFETRSHFDFLTLSTEQFFHSKSNEEMHPSDNFYEDLTEKQLMYENYVYEHDEKTGIFSVYDTRENIKATIKIFPIKHVRKKLARIDVLQDHFRNASSN